MLKTFIRQILVSAKLRSKFTFLVVVSDNVQLVFDVKVSLCIDILSCENTVQYFLHDNRFGRFLYCCKFNDSCSEHAKDFYVLRKVEGSNLWTKLMINCLAGSPVRPLRQPSVMFILSRGQDSNLRACSLRFTVLQTVAYPLGHLDIVFLCRWGESNPHSVIGNWILSPARLPIPPHRHEEGLFSPLFFVSSDYVFEGIEH